MRSVIIAVAAYLPATLGMDSYQGEILQSLMPRQQLTFLCNRTTTPESDPNFCRDSCGKGKLRCPPAGPRTCYDHAGGDTCCSDGRVCSPGYYCSNKGCCPEGSTLEECGATTSLFTTFGVANTAPAPSQSPSSPPGSPEGYGSSSSAVAPPPEGYGPSSSTIPPPPPAYSSVLSETPTPSPSPPTPYSPPPISDSRSYTPSGPSGYPPVITDSFPPTSDHPTGYPPVISSTPVGPSGYPPVITDSWSSTPSTPPTYPTVPVPSNGTNGTAPWYPPPAQQTNNAAAKGEVAGWAFSGLTLLGLGFFL